VTFPVKKFWVAKLYKIIIAKGRTQNGSDHSMVRAMRDRPNASRGRLPALKRP
jgi:hypothetical protein